MNDPHVGLPLTTMGPPMHHTRRVAIMVHGRNASPRSILELVPRLDRPGFTYLAPSAANNTWYPFSFLEPIERNETFLSSALRRLEAPVGGVPPSGVQRASI